MAISSTDRVLVHSGGNLTLDDALPDLVSALDGRINTLENAGYVVGSGTNGQVAVFSGTSITGVATLAASKGGTGFGSYTTGDILYADSTTTLAKVALGAANSLLSSSGSAPTWITAPSSADTFLKWDGSAFTWATASAAASGVTSIDVSGGSTGLTTSGGPVTSSGTVTLAGILNGASGGTGVNNSGKTITLGGNLVTSGAFNTTLTVTADTSVTLPTSGTLATTASDITGNAATATTATNVAGGLPNKLVYQSAANTTAFADAPSTGNTFLEWSGTVFQWSAIPSAPVTSVAGKTGVVTLDVSDVSGAAATANKLDQFADTTSAELAGVISDETGSGALVFANSPTLVSPVLGAASATSLALTTALPLTSGGTGAANAADARTNLGLGTAATKDAGTANGVASLDANGKVPTSELPASVLGDVSYQNTWNAATNTPTLTSSTGTKGHYYVVSASGATNLDGITDWQIGDWVIFNGSVWEKVDNTDSVTSVAGKTGSVTLVVGDVSGAAATASDLSQFASTTSAALAGVISDETGSGSLVFSTSPTLVTPVLGAASATSLTLTTALDAQYGGTGVDNSGKTITLGGNLVTSGAFSTTLTVTGNTNVTLPTTGTLITASDDITGNAATATTATKATNVAGGGANQIPYQSAADTTTFLAPSTGFLEYTGTALQWASLEASDVSGAAATASGLNQFAATTSADLAGVISDETGTGSLVFSNSPTLTTPSLGVATGTKLTLTSATAPALTATFDTALTTGVYSVAQIKVDSSSDVTGTLGAAADFVIRDSADTDYTIARVIGQRHTADNTGDLIFHTSNAGSMGEAGRFTNDNKLQLQSALEPAYGGTGQTTYAKGDTLYSDAANSLAKLTVGSTGTIMRVSSSGIPEWSSSLDASFGGTGIISYSAGDIVYADTTSSLTTVNIGSSGTVLTSSGSAPQWSAPSTLSVGTATKATNVAGGDANQIPYQSAADTTTFLAPATGFLEYTGTTLQWASLEASDVSGAAATASGLNQFAATTSEELAVVISDETGTGSLVFATSPTLTSPSLSGAVGSSSDIYFRPNSSGSNTVQMTYDSGNNLARLVAGTNSSAAGRLEAIAYTVASSERPGSIRLQEYDGTDNFLWVDDTGDFRIHTSTPAVASDTSGTVVGIQSFTGAHFYSTDAIVDAAADDGTVAYLAVGDAVRLANGKILRSTAPNQKDVVGVFMGMTHSYKNSLTNETSTPAKLDENGQVIEPEVIVWQAAVASVGDNRDFSIVQDSLRGFNVCNENGPIEAGDYLVSSSTPGYLMKQSDDLMRSSTVGKALEAVTFDSDGKAREIYGYVYCG